MADILLMITGLSGAASGVADVLEDLGWFVVDNLPTALIGTMVRLAAKPTSRTSSAWRSSPDASTPRCSPRLARLADGHDVRVVFLDGTRRAPELVRRYDATRRRHPSPTATPTASSS